MEIFWSGDKIRKIENLPNNLKIFSINVIKINKLENLPNNLEILAFQNTLLTKLENLPNSIKIINCRFNKLTKIENLPQNLIEFCCYDNKFSIFENLPNSLEIFGCYHNKISKIENLPNSLKIFNYDDNLITEIDNIKIQWLETHINILDENLLTVCNMIKFMQLRYKLKFRCKTRVANKIQAACYNWLWSSKCRDNTIGINVRLQWNIIQNIYKENS